MADNIVSFEASRQAMASFRADERGHLTLEAAWEISSIASELQRHFSVGNCRADQLFFRGVAIRLEQLAGVVLGCLDDERCDLTDARHAVDGPEMTRMRADGDAPAAG